MDFVLSKANEPHGSSLDSKTLVTDFKIKSNFCSQCNQRVTSAIDNENFEQGIVLS